MLRKFGFLGLILGLILMKNGWSVYQASQAKVLSATSDLSLEDRVASLERRVYSLEKKTGIVKTKSTKTSEVFVQLSGGTAVGGEWTKIVGSDFSLDLSLYGEVSEVTWQGWMDNGYGYVRLYDATNHRAVDNSEILVSSDTKASFYSKALSIWRGQNQYYIEVKSPVWGSVTISGPQLRIVTK